MKVRKANQRLASDLRRLTHDADELIKATANGTGERVNAVRKGLTNALESAKTTCDRWQDKSLQVAKATDHVISEHRYESIGIAFGVGLLVGVVMRHY